MLSLMRNCNCCWLGYGNQVNDFEHVLEMHLRGEEIDICRVLSRIHDPTERQDRMEDLIDMLFESLKKQKFSEYVDEHSDAVRRLKETIDPESANVAPAEKYLGARDIVDICCICVEEFEP